MNTLLAYVMPIVNRGIREGVEPESFVPFAPSIRIEFWYIRSRIYNSTHSRETYL